MSRKKHGSKAVSNSASSHTAGSHADSAPQLTHKQQAIGLALAGGALSTPLLLALFEKTLSFEEIKSICCRAREIASHFEDLPEGKFALACLDDFLLPRTPSRLNQEADASSPTIVPSDVPDSSQPAAGADVTVTDS
jgi:hypothetical protein